MEELKLDRNRKRAEQCPCGKNNKDGKFVPFVGFDCAGYCHACGETIMPESNKAIVEYKPLPPKPIIPFPEGVVKLHMSTGMQYNNFLLGLKMFFGWNVAKVAKKYNIGTWQYEKQPEYLANYNGSAIFFLQDAQGRYRSGKVMSYNSTNLKRNKDIQTNWVHSLYKYSLTRNLVHETYDIKYAAEYELESCFFGEHLLATNLLARIVIVESEKTAIIANECGKYEGFIFLASGGSQGLNQSKFKALAGRQILILPDNDIVMDAQKLEVLKKKVEQLNKLGYEVKILPNSTAFSGAKGDLADALIQEKANSVWHRLTVEEKEIYKDLGFLQNYSVNKLEFTE
jgi:hypothetical protein